VSSDRLKRFKRVLASYNKIFSGNAQQDAHELLGAPPPPPARVASSTCTLLHPPRLGGINPPLPTPLRRRPWSAPQVGIVDALSEELMPLAAQLGAWREEEGGGVMPLAAAGGGGGGGEGGFDAAGRPAGRRRGEEEGGGGLMPLAAQLGAWGV
jgi:hypothetical protein